MRSEHLGGKVVLHGGDSRDVLKGLADASIDSVCTDPPYALVSIVKRFGADGAAPTKDGDVYSRSSSGFMGKQWDTGETAFATTFWAEIMRVLKPGGHVVAFSGTRTYHRLAVAIEDAGFEIRDQLAWAYGSGFPKSHDVSKGIDRIGGVHPNWNPVAYENAVSASGKTHADVDRFLNVKASSCYWARTDHRACVPIYRHWTLARDFLGLDDNFAAVGNEADRPDRDTRLGVASGSLSGTTVEVANAGTPATDAARQWQGWGTALKPSWEPIVLARKPLAGTVAANVLEHGTGALNIDGCRVGTEGGTAKGSKPEGDGNGIYGAGLHGACEITALDKGRWPANIIHDGSDEVVAAFPRRDIGGGPKAANPTPGSVWGIGADRSSVPGSAARFFFQAQESDIEWLVRNLNLSHADIVEFLSFPPNGAVCSALNDAVTSGLPAEAQCEVLCPERIMSVTATELRVIAEAVIAATQTIGERFLHGLPLESTTELPNHAQFALRRMPTGIITITISRWTSDGCADPVTFNITPLNSEAGAPASARSTARLFYSSKADKQDRIGSKHPTVKPVDLMQWLCRLVTPPGGTVLDPFAGSGSTGEAAWREGFNCVLIEREEEYQADIAERLRLADKGPLERRQRAIKQSDDIGGLFAPDNDNAPPPGGDRDAGYTATSPIRTNDWPDRTEAMTPEQEAAARALAASIPPTKSTPEEIAARRAARRALKEKPIAA